MSRLPTSPGMAAHLDNGPFYSSFLLDRLLADEVASQRDEDHILIGRLNTPAPPIVACPPLSLGLMEYASFSCFHYSHLHDLNSALLFDTHQEGCDGMTTPRKFRHVNYT